MSETLEIRWHGRGGQGMGKVEKRGPEGRLRQVLTDPARTFLTSQSTF